jgi:polyferredoxin
MNATPAHPPRPPRRRRLRSWFGLANVRRIVQGGFLLLFLLLLVRTTLVGENGTEPWAGLFFDLDPLVLLSSWLASGGILPGMLLALVTVGLTLLLGRFFCGWVCPVGTTFNIISWARRMPAARLIRTGVWNRWQHSKYLLLTGLLVAALCGLNLAGVFDPFSFFYRTVSTSLYPAFARGTEQFFTWLYNTDPGIGPVRITLVSEPVYALLRAHVLPHEPVAYFGGVLIGFTFLLLVVLALFHFRFWCRYLCPLGALLGTCSKAGRIELRMDEAKCAECNLCVAWCPGACDPHLPGRWKKEECYLCFTCRDQCTEQAITFHWTWGKESRLLVPAPRIASPEAVRHLEVVGDGPDA